MITTHKIKTYKETKEIPFIEKLEQYTKGLPLDDTTKGFILDKKFITDNPSYYAYYPYLFSNAFELDTDIDLLSIAGFLYYKSILTIDDTFDKESFNPKLFFLANICQEEAIKILTSLFGRSSSFWSFWNKRKGEYARALHIDKTTKDISSFEEFEQLAEYKSAIGKVAIDSLHLLSEKKDKSTHQDILNSHKYFYAGFQVLDDIDDFKEDIENNQFNIAYSSLKGKLKKQGYNFDDLSLGNLNKHLYLSGTVDDLLNKALAYFEKSEAIVDKYNLPDWKKQIRKLYNVAIVRKLNIEAYIKKIKVDLQLSHEPNHNHTINKVTDLGIQFIEKSQNENGSWQEWYNDAGLSDTWATSFILSFICQKKSNHKFQDHIIEKAFDFIKTKNRNLWGYNNQWIPDADSTTFALLAFNNNDSKKEMALTEWLSYQNIDFGFSTYNNDEDLSASLDREICKKDELAGWLNSHVCVSAAAFYYLSKTNPSSKTHKNLKQYVINNINNEDLWDSYWWTSAIYSTAFLIKSSVYFYDENFKTTIHKAIKGLLQSQNDNGSFGDLYTKESAFYTALMVDALCEDEELSSTYHNQIQKAVTWLLNNQLSDGSWKETAALRIPAPFITDSSEVKDWKEDTKGLNIRVSEFNRLFTTSITVSALSKYDFYRK